MSGVKDSTKEEALQARARLPRTIRWASAVKSQLHRGRLETTQEPSELRGQLLALGLFNLIWNFLFSCPLPLKTTKQNNILQTV